MSERRNTKDLIDFYKEEFKTHFKDYQIKEVSDTVLAISADGKEWNIVQFGATWCVDRDTKLGFVPKYNPDTCPAHKRYLKELELKAKRVEALERHRERERIRKQNMKGVK